MGARSSQSRGPGLNETDGHLLEYFRDTFSAGGGGTNFVPLPNTGHTATGGIISDYTTGPGDVYRAHGFTASDTFEVTSGGAYGNNIDFLVLGGGGGGAADVAPPRIKLSLKYSIRCPSVLLKPGPLLCEDRAPIVSYLRYQYHQGFDS